jgi:hypothetical protein
VRGQRLGAQSLRVSSVDQVWRDHFPTLSKQDLVGEPLAYLARTLTGERAVTDIVTTDSRPRTMRNAGPRSLGSSPRRDATSTPRQDDRFEEVAIDALHVGDYVFIAQPTSHIGARCVLSKTAKSTAGTARVVGWLIELAGGELAWWLRDATVWRRRFA